MRKVDGVDKVDVSLNQGLTTLELKRDNRVTLSQLRAVIKNNGFVSKEAVIVAAGDIETDGFHVSGTGELLKPSAKPEPASGGQFKFTVAK